MYDESPDPGQRSAEEINLPVSPQNATDDDTDLTVQVFLARLVIYALCALSAAACVAACMRLPSYFELSFFVLWLTPLLIVLLLYLYPSLFRLFKAKSDPQVEVLFSLLLPAVSLLFASTFGVSPHYVDSSQMYTWFALVFVLYTVALIKPLSRNPSLLLPALLLPGLYSFSGVYTVNAVLDHSPAQLYHAQVLDTQKHTRRAGMIDLAPWGPKTNGNVVNVSPKIYYNVQPGGDVCVDLHPGFLHAAWYTITIC